jgi:hypothetical protein
MNLRQDPHINFSFMSYSFIISIKIQIPRESIMLPLLLVILILIDNIYYKPFTISSNRLIDQLIHCNGLLIGRMYCLSVNSHILRPQGLNISVLDKTKGER